MKKKLSLQFHAVAFSFRKLLAVENISFKRGQAGRQASCLQCMNKLLFSFICNFFCNIACNTVCYTHMHLSKNSSQQLLNICVHVHTFTYRLLNGKLVRRKLSQIENAIHFLLDLLNFKLKSNKLFL